MRLLFIIYITFTFSSIVIAQNPKDVLKQSLLLSDKGNFFQSNKILHTYISKNKETLSKEETMNFIFEIFNNHHASLSDSTKFYLNLLNKYQSQYRFKNFDEKILYCEGITFLKVKKYDLAMQKMVSCNAKSLNSNNIDYQVKSKKVIGLLFFFNKNYKKAKEYYKKAIKIEKNENNFDIKILLANCYLTEKKNDSSWFVLNQIKNKASSLNDSIQLFANFAQYYLNVSEPLTSLKYANQAKNLLAKQQVDGALKEFNETLNSNSNVAEKLDKLFEIGKYEIAKEVILETQKIGAEINHDSITEKEMLQKMLDYKDSVFFQNQNEKIASIETQYQTKKKELENVELKNRNNNLLLILLGISLFSSIIYWFYKKTKKQKEVTEFQKTEIEKQKISIENLQRVLHHENKNNLTRISTFIDVAIDDTKDEQIISKLSETKNRLDTIYEVHKQLYLSENLTDIDLKKYIDKLISNIQYTHDKKQVIVQNLIDNGTSISPEKVFSLGLICNELTTNSFKHAFEKTEKPQISINITKKDQKYCLDFSDNGIGLPRNFDIKNLDSYGFELIKVLVKELNGTLQINNSNGLKINIEF